MLFDPTLVSVCQINESELYFSNNIGILGVKIYLMQRDSHGQQLYLVSLLDFNGNNTLATSDCMHGARQK